MMPMYTVPCPRDSDHDSILITTEYEPHPEVASSEELVSGVWVRCGCELLPSELDKATDAAWEPYGEEG